MSVKALIRPSPSPAIKAIRSVGRDQVRSAVGYRKAFPQGISNPTFYQSNTLPAVSVVVGTDHIGEFLGLSADYGLTYIGLRHPLTRGVTFKTTMGPLELAFAPSPQFRAGANAYNDWVLDVVSIAEGGTIGRLTRLSPEPADNDEANVHAVADFRLRSTVIIFGGAKAIGEEGESPFARGAALRFEALEPENPAGTRHESMRVRIERLEQAEAAFRQADAILVAAGTLLIRVRLVRELARYETHMGRYPLAHGLFVDASELAQRALDVYKAQDARAGIEEVHTLLEVLGADKARAARQAAGRPRDVGEARLKI